MLTSIGKTTVLFFLIITIGSQSVHAAARKTLLIAAAADLSFALKKIAKDFEKDTNINITLSFGSTGMLSLQIENGAPFDVFFAANERYMDGLRKKGLLIPDTQHLYAQGRIVLAVNKTTGIRVSQIEDLLKPSIKKIAIANPDHAPYGIAAKEALFKSGLWDKLKSKLVYTENIRQTVQFIQTANAPAGIIALSVADVPDIEYAIIDRNLYSPINQSVGIIKTTKSEKEARQFIEYVNGDKGRTIMKRYGFFLPGEF